MRYIALAMSQRVQPSITVRRNKRCCPSRNRARTPTGETPAAGAARRFKVVATVEALDRPAQTVTVQGPLGNYFTARVADVSNLTRMKIGDKVVLTGTEAVAISLEPAPRASNR